MAESRVEKYREYRKSIISNGSPIAKETIDTTLVSTANESKDIDLSREIELANSIRNKKILSYSIFGLINLAIISLLIVYGIKVF